MSACCLLGRQGAGITVKWQAYGRTQRAGTEARCECDEPHSVAPSEPPVFPAQSKDSLFQVLSSPEISHWSSLEGTGTVRVTLCWGLAEKVADRKAVCATSVRTGTLRGASVRLSLCVDQEDNGKGTA